MLGRLPARLFGSHTSSALHLSCVTSSLYGDGSGTTVSVCSPRAYLQVYRPINPKAVTRNELYGYLHPTTREWKEGLVSVTFREMANNSTNKHQWIVLDGDIDAGGCCWCNCCLSGP